MKLHLEPTISDLPLVSPTHCADVLLHVYQYLDGKLSHLPNKSNDAVITLMIAHECILFIARSTIEEVYGNDKANVEAYGVDKTIDLVPLSKKVYMLMLRGF